MHFEFLCWTVRTKPEERVVKENCHDALLTFDDAEAILEIFDKIPELSHMYMIEITPATDSWKVKTIGLDGRGDRDKENNKSPTDFELETLFRPSNGISLPLHDLEDDKGAINFILSAHRDLTCYLMISEYKIRISTLVNGWIIGSKTILQRNQTPFDTTGR